MMTIDYSCFPTKRWGYEKASVNARLLSFNRTEEWESIHRQWAKHFNRSVDNKVVFEVKTQYSDKPLYVFFKDNAVHIDVEVRPYHGMNLTDPEFPVQS